MFNSNFPFGYSNYGAPFGGVPFSGAPSSCSPSNCSPFNGDGGYSNYAPVSGWNSGSFGGFGGCNSPSFDGAYNSFGYPGYNFSNGHSHYSPFGHSSNTPFNGNHNWYGAGFGGQGYNNWNSAPFGGYGHNSWNSAPPVGYGHNNWNQAGVSGHFAHPMSCNTPFSGMEQSMGFPGMNWNNAWMGSSTPWMNSGSYFPGNVPSQFTGASNWYSSPWMGYAYPNFVQHNNAVSNGKASAPVNGQFIPNSAFPFPCAPFNVPFPANGYVPAGQGANCEAA